MSENQASKHEIGFISIILTCVMLSALAVFSSNQSYDSQPRKDSGQEHNASYNPATLREQFKGQKPNDPAYCYEGETPADCAGRSVQQKVAGLYVWLIVAAGAQFFVGLITAYTVYEQTKITRRQLSIAASSAGPVIFLREFRCEWLHAVTDKNRVMAWRFTPIWENTGQGLARKFISRSSFQTFTSNIPDDFDFPDLEPLAELVPTHLGPGSKMEFGAFEVPVYNLVAIRKNICNVFIWGWGEYLDIVGGPPTGHRVEFCNRIIVFGDPKEKDCKFSFPFYGNHNGEGDACYRKPGEKAQSRTQSTIVLPISLTDWTEFGLDAPETSPQSTQTDL